MSHLSPYSQQVAESMCGIHQENRLLNPYSERIWWHCYVCVCEGEGGVLLAGFGSTCPLRGKGHCKLSYCCSEWSPLSYDETFLSWCGIVLRQDNAPIHRKWRVAYAMAFTVTRSQPYWTPSHCSPALLNSLAHELGPDTTIKSFKSKINTCTFSSKFTGM